MIRRSDVTVSDAQGTPEGGVYITVKNSLGALATLYTDAGGALANPFQSTAVTGVFTYNIADTDAGTFTEEYRINLADSPRTIEAIDLSVNSVAVRYAATRTALALMTTTLPVILTESGREGQFVWSSANLATKVTADPQQGIYVAPASAPTGASGAWVRKFSGELNVKWFGATGDGTTVDYAAFVACQNYIASLARAMTGYNVGVPKVFVPFGVYNFAGNPFDCIFPIHWFGESGGFSSSGTILKWNNTSSGTRIQYVDTVGEAGTQAPASSSGSGTIWEDVTLDGGFDNLNEAERHGVLARAQVKLIRVSLFNWAGEGVKINGNTGAGVLGNANLCVLLDCFAQNCRNGYFSSGGDSNACHILNFSTIACREWGCKEGSFLGNQIMGGHWDVNARNAWNSGAANRPCSYVHDSGNIYFVINGQAAGAATNRPSTTTASNTWWGWWAAGGAAPASGIPTWFNGINVRAGGPILVDGVSNQTVVVSPHIESNGVCQLDQYGMLIGNSFTTGNVVRVSGGVYYQNSMANLTSVLGGFAMAGKLNARGDINGLSASNNFGPTSGTATDSALTLNTTNTSNSIVFNVGGVFKTVIKNVSNWFYYDTIAGGQHNFRINGVDLGQFDTNGINISSGMRLSYNGTAVLTAGVLTAAAFPVLTGDVTTAGGSLATVIGANKVTLGMMATLAATSLIGNATGGAATPTAITLAGGLSFLGTTITPTGGALAPASVAIGSGTALTKAVVYTPTITPASVAAATVAEQTFTVTGLTTADKVVVNPPSIANATGISGVRVSAADTLAIRFVNPTAGALTPTSGTYTVLAFRS